MFQKAENALKFYKGYKGKSKQEVDAIFKEFERQKSIASERKMEERIRPSDFCKFANINLYFSWKSLIRSFYHRLGNKGALKGFAVGFALNAFVQLTANFTIISYAVMIFERTGTSIDPYFSSVILALALIVGSVCTTYLADILGRRILNIVSLAGSAVGLFAVSLHHYLYINGYDLSAFVWVPVVSLSFVVFISSSGINALAYCCTVEYFPHKVIVYETKITNFHHYSMLVHFSGSNGWLCDYWNLVERCHIHVYKTVPNVIGAC